MSASAAATSAAVRSGAAPASSGATGAATADRPVPSIAAPSAPNPRSLARARGQSDHELARTGDPQWRTLVRGQVSGTGYAPGPRPAALGRTGARAVRTLAVPVLHSGRPARRLHRLRLRRRQLGHDRGTGALATARVRPAGVHHRPVPVPGRPAVRAGREPDRRLPADLHAARG